MKTFTRMEANLSPITTGKQKSELERFESSNVVTFRPHKCDICERKFKKIGERNQHVKIVHLNVRPFKCDNCSKDFPKKSKLIRHIDQVLCFIQNNYLQQK